MWRRRDWCGAVIASWALSACAPFSGRSAGQAATPYSMTSVRQDDGLWHAPVLLLGEQHDAPAHHEVQAELVNAFIHQGRLRALLLEMVDSPHHTEGLKPSASETQVQDRLAWSMQSWPWADYSEAIMAAVRAGIPVRGANLRRAEMGSAMMDKSLDEAVSAVTLKALQEAVKTGHCNLLPESQLAPMARIQIAKDRRMAETIAAQAREGQTVVVLCGSAHAHKQHGIPAHLPRELAARAISVHLRSANHDPSEPGAFDREWLTVAVQEKDYCAELRQRWGKAAGN